MADQSAPHITVVSPTTHWDLVRPAPNSTTITVGDKLVGVARLQHPSISQAEAREAYESIEAAGRQSAGGKSSRSANG